MKLGLFLRIRIFVSAPLDVLSLRSFAQRSGSRRFLSAFRIAGIGPCIRFGKRSLRREYLCCAIRGFAQLVSVVNVPFEFVLRAEDAGIYQKLVIH